MLDLIFLRNRLAQFLRKNAPKKKVIIINSYDRIDMLAKVAKSLLGYFGSNTSILCFKSSIPEEFGDFRDKVKISEDYLNHHDYLNIDNYVFDDISKNWDGEVREAFKNVFAYREVALARIAEYNLQLFLIIKIKALAVIDRAIKEEGYEAVFIVDSNRELEHFDRLLWRHYHLPNDFVRIEAKELLIDQLRKKTVSLISDLIDSLAPLLTGKNKQARLIDARLFYHLGLRKNQGNFILAPFEKGLRLRLKCLLKNSGYISFHIGTGSAERRRRYLKDLKKFDLRDLTNQFIFENIPYAEIIEDKIKTLIWKDFARFRRNIDILVDAHNRYKIKSIVLRNDLREIEKTVVLLSKRNNITTFVIQHGILAEPNGSNIIFADKIAVWGQHAVCWYANFGNDSGKTIVVGNPNLDRIVDYNNLKKNENLLDKLGLSKKKYLITLIGSGIGKFRMSSFETDDVTRNLIRETIKAIKPIGNINLVVKLHPNEKIKTFVKMVSPEDRTTVAIIDKIDLHKLIEASDLIMTVDSTVGLDAVIMKKPVAVLNLSKRPDLVPYVEKNVAIGAYRASDVEGVIRKALYDKDAKRKMGLAREDFINHFVYKTDGRTRERILELIEN